MINHAVHNQYKWLILALLLVPVSVFSWSVSPSNYTIEEGGNPYYYLTISARNITEAIPIEIYAAKRMIDKSGKNTWERIDDKFFIYPSICVVSPGGIQKVRVFWKGGFKDMKQEEAYRIIVESLPVAIKENKIRDADKGIRVGLQVLKTYVTSLFILPKNAKPNPLLQSYRITELNGEKVLVLTFKNLGNKHITLNNYALTLTSGQHTFQIDQDYVLKNNEILTLLPFHERECIIPFPNNFPMEFCEVSMKILNYR